MINTLLSFGAKSVNPALLEQTLTTRRKIVDEIEEHCVEKVLKETTYQSLIVAPRGSGKTHIIKVLYHRLKNNKSIDEKSVIAYMSEDEVGIANFTDLLINVFRAFIRYEEPNSLQLTERIEEAADIIDPDKRIDYIKKTLTEFAKGKIIILLIENFDNIMDALGKQGQAELRDYLHEQNNLSILATSQNLISSLQKSDYPFYNFFSIFHLKKLTFEEAFSFFKKIAESEKNDALLAEMDSQEFYGKIRTIYELTEGNHRLLVTFYSFLKAEFKAEFSTIFIKVMNDLKPYYEQFVNALGPQQQKIVKFLSQNRRAVSGKEIARSCFIDPNTLSKQTSLLFENGMIDKNKSGKDVFYELKEPLMRICFEIGDNPNGIASLFVDFLSSFYASQEISSKYLEYKYGAPFQVEEVRPKYLSEASMYYLALPERLKTAIETVEINLQSISNLDELHKKIKDIIPQIHLDSSNILSVTDLRKKILSLKGIDIGTDIPVNELADIVTNNIALTLEEMNTTVFLMETGITETVKDLIKALKNTMELATNTFGLDLYNTFLQEIHSGAENVISNIDTLKTIVSKPEFKDSVELNCLLGNAYRENSEWGKSINYYLNCYQQQPNNERLLTVIIEIYSELGDYVKSLQYIKTALDYYPENPTFSAYLESNLIQLEMVDELKPIIQRNISIKNPFEIQSYIESLIFVVFFTEKSTPFLTSLISFLIDELKNKSETEKLWQAITRFIFTYLANSENLSLENGEVIKNRMIDSLAGHKEAIIPLKILSTGIEHLIKGNKNALFELSKEERKVFKENVLDEIEKRKLASKTKS